MSLTKVRCPCVRDVTCPCVRDGETLQSEGEHFLKLLRKLKPLLVSFLVFGVVFTFFVYTMYTSGGYVPPPRSEMLRERTGDTGAGEGAGTGGEGGAGAGGEDRETLLRRRGNRTLYLTSAFEVTGLGNLMFQYASLAGIARHSGRTPVVPRDFRLLGYFHLTALPGNGTRPGEGWGKVLEAKANSFDRLVYETPLSSTSDLELVGYHQSWYYFREYIEEIRKEFTFHQNIIDQARTWLTGASKRYRQTFQGRKSIKADDIVYIGIHIRRGDMAKRDFLDFGYTVADTQYLDTAMKYFAQKYKNSIFMFTSDDIGWTKKHFSGKQYRTLFSQGHTDIVDMAILAICNHTVTTTGTFSWWVGFLSQGEVTYYKNFPRKGSRLERGFSQDRKDYFFSGWKGL